MSNSRDHSHLFEGVFFLGASVLTFFTVSPWLGCLFFLVGLGVLVFGPF